jgi:hypothetical protein
VAAIFGIFAGFWLSYAVLVVGLLHNWFGIGLPTVVATEKLFLLSWLVLIVMLNHPFGDAGTPLITTHTRCSRTVGAAVESVTDRGHPHHS